MRLLALLVALILPFVAVADERADTVRVLFRAKAAIETGLTTSDLAALTRQLDEQLALARAAKSDVLTAKQFEATAAAASHLRQVMRLWTYLSDAHCRNRNGLHDLRQDALCRSDLRYLMSEVGLKLEDLTPNESPVDPQRIIREALEISKQKVTAAIETFR
jgi:hypothetical protein